MAAKDRAVHVSVVPLAVAVSVRVVTVKDDVGGAAAAFSDPTLMVRVWVVTLPNDS